MSDLDRLRSEYALRKQRLSGSALYTPFNAAHLFALQQRQRAVVTMLRRQKLTTLRHEHSLEVGCGTGGVLLELLGLGASPVLLQGTDLLPDRVAQAHELLPHLALTCADGQQLPYKPHSFDLVLQYTVFSSVLDSGIKAHLAREMLRVLRPGGLILWYDFWLNPTNKQTRGIRPAEIKHLFPNCSFEFKRITLAPPLARLVAPRSWFICYLLESLRILNTHYLVGIRQR